MEEMSNFLSWLADSFFLSLLTNQDENKQQLFCVLSINFEPIY